MQQPEYYSYIPENLQENPFQQGVSVYPNNCSNFHGNLPVENDKDYDNKSTPFLEPFTTDKTVAQPEQQQEQSYHYPQQQQRIQHVVTTASNANNSNIMKGTTDFRRRKNWTERILVEMAGLLHVLSTTGKFLYCSESTFELTGYRPHELVGQAILDFLHVDDMDVFIRDFQMSFYTRSKIRTYYRFRKKDDTYVIFEVVGQPQRTDPSQQQQQQHQQQEQQQQQQQQHQAPTSFFAIAQPVPTKSGGLMDTFLELKAENIWLRERIEELKQQQSTKYHKSNGDSGVNNQVVTESIDDNEELQQQQQQQLEVGATPLNMIAPIDPCKTTDSIKLNRLFRGVIADDDTDNRTTNNGYKERAESWLLNTNYLPGTFQRSTETSTINSSSSSRTNTVVIQRLALSAGIMTEKKVQWKRRKKQKGPDEYVCADCGTTSSPEWRKGPHGPKSLCNACGLRWAKRNKQDRFE